ncbi:MAG TPA: acyl-CoA dehydrogenase family protein [Streptosporangiaceae bacterium]
MDLSPDPLLAQLRRALRAGLAGAASRPAVRGVPVSDGPDSPARDVLADLGMPRCELPLAAGGLDLGLAVGVTVSEELGRAACGNPYRAAAFTADAALACGRADVLGRLLAGATVAAAGLEALPPGSAVAARRAEAGWTLSGTVTVDAPGADLAAVLTRIRGGPALALLPGRSAGLTWHPGRWPHVLELAGVPAGKPELLRRIEPPGGGALTRAQVRQAAYLLGLAAGMHDAAVRYTGTRRQFGGPLRDLQAVSFPLARAVVALRATRMLVYRAAWFADTGRPSTAPAEALAAAAEALADIARLCMQACGSRSMTSQLPLHRYYRLAAAELVRYGRPAALWRLVGATAVAGCGAGTALAGTALAGTALAG